MKKLVSIVLCLFMLLNLVGCSGSTNEAPYTCGKAVYKQLNLAADICIDMMDSIYAAWYFAIHEADDYSFNAVRGLASKTGFTEDALESAYEDMGGSASRLSDRLEDFNVAVAVIKQVYVNNGTVKRLDDALTSAKNELRTMTNEYSDYSEYPDLKSFYSEVSSYAEFAKNPSGSFSQLKTTIDNYETNIRTYKATLAFVFED